MDKYLGRFSGPIYALVRFVFGFLFMFHGAQKLFGAFGGQVAGAPLFQAAGIIEFAGGIMIAIGLLSSWVGFLASGEMAVAYFMMHQPQGTWPIENRGELVVLFCFFFLYVAAHGSGPFSVDAMMRKKA